MQKFDKMIVHSGIFHSDDVYSVAFMKMLMKEKFNIDLEVERKPGFKITEEEFNNSNIVIADVGNTKYDHHRDKEYRDPEKKEGMYAAFGKLWRDFGIEFCNGNKTVADRIDKRLIEPLDASDNGLIRSDLASQISMFNPTYLESGKGDEFIYNQFMKAVDFAEMNLQRARQKYLEIYPLEEQVLEDYENSENKTYCTLHEYVPTEAWQEALMNTDCKYAIWESNRGGYMAWVMPEEVGSFDGKIQFQDEWLGKSTEELKDLTGIDGIQIVLGTEGRGYAAVADDLEKIQALVELNTELVMEKENTINNTLDDNSFGSQLKQAEKDMKMKENSFGIKENNKEMIK